MTATQTTAGTSTWTVDPTHSEIGFAVRHLMISTVRGRFGGVTGSVVADEANPTKAKIDISVDVTTVDTRTEQRDAHLRSADFFDVEKFPTMHFVGTEVDGDVTGDFKVTGNLTIRGVIRPVTLDVTSEGSVRDPWGNDRVGFSAKGKLSRADYGLTYNQALEAGGVVIGDEIKLSIDVELVRQAAAPAA
jgi:polyisoprenoid-binding protein YceI